jgi:two-component system nitrate/nitrite response regulator NarL
MGRLILVVPNRLYRDGLGLSLTGAGFEIVAAVAAPELLPEAGGDADKCDLVLIQCDTVEELRTACARIRAAYPTAKIVMLANPEIAPTATARALETGIDSIVLPQGSTDSFVQSLRLAQMGECTIPMRLAMQLVATGEGEAIAATGEMAKHNLSNREQQILRLLVVGHSNKEIAKALSITEATVKVHVKSVLRKVQAANRTQAAIWALNHGIGEAAD